MKPLKIASILVFLVTLVAAAQARIPARASSGVSVTSVTFSTRDIHNGGRVVVRVGLVSTETQGIPVSCTADLDATIDSPPLPLPIPLDRCSVRRVDASHYRLEIVRTFPRVVVDRTYHLKRVKVVLKTRKGLDEIWAKTSSPSVKVSTAGQMQSEQAGWALQMATKTGKYAVKVDETFDVHVLVSGTSPIVGGSIAAHVGPVECLPTPYATCAQGGVGHATFNVNATAKRLGTYDDGISIWVASVKSIPLPAMQSQVLVLTLRVPTSEAALYENMPSLGLRFDSMTFLNADLQQISVNEHWFTSGGEAAVVLPLDQVTYGKGLRILTIEK